MKISVIVPVYNVEPYLQECLDSIINQDYRNLEIILINDGSTDNSGNICNNYAQIDSRIKVIHQENKGVSYARNTGLMNSTGDLISFIDSDDWINQGMYSTIINNLTDDIDVTLIPIPNPNIANESSLIYKLDREQIRKEFISTYLGAKKISLNKPMTSVCALCIRKELIHNLFFIDATYEDLPYFIEVILKAKNVLVIPKKFYNYQYNPNSITRKYNKNYARDWSLVNKKTKEILLQYNAYSSLVRNRFNNTVICIYYHLIKNEASNEKLIIPNPALKQYYIDNKIDELLNLPKMLEAVLTKPKILLIKLGYSNYLLKKRWKKHHNKRTITI